MLIISGYADSSADIAYALRCKGVDVITPTPKPEVTRDLDWSFPDTVASVRSAVSEHGVNVFWANTILHSKHSLVELSDVLISKDVRIVGQNPLDTEKFDDKEWLNRWLAEQAGLQGCFPRSHLLTKADMLDLGGVRLPAVVKPVRGRGSHGVKVVRSVEELKAGLEGLLKESDAVLCEVGRSASFVVCRLMLVCLGVLGGRRDNDNDYAAWQILGRHSHKYLLAF